MRFMQSAIVIRLIACLLVYWLSSAGRIPAQSLGCARCPADTTFVLPGNACEWVVDSAASWFAPMVTDSCGDEFLRYYRLGGSLSIDSLPSLIDVRLPTGTTTVSTYLFYANGSSDTCQFVVTVRDTTPPVLACPQNIGVTITTGSNCSYSAAGAEFNPLSWQDNCGAAGLSWASIVRNPVGDTLYSRDFGPLPSLTGVILPRGISTVSWYVRDAAGNSSSCSLPVEVLAAYEGQIQPLIDGSPVQETAVCLQQTFQLSYIPAGIPVVRREWWRNGELLPFDGSFLSEHPASAGVYDYQLRIVDNAGCDYELGYSSEVYSLPVPAIEGSSLLCVGNRVRLEIADSYSEYQWTVNGAPAGNESLYISEPQTEEGSYLYRVRVKDGNGCRGEDSLSVQLISNPQPQIVGALDFCANQQEVVFVAAGGIPAGSGREFAWEIPGNWASVRYQRADSLVIRVAAMLPPPPFQLIVRETINSQIACYGSDTLSLSALSGQTAPDEAAIGYLPAGNVLVCADGGYCYQWGYTDRLSGNEVLLAGENYQTYVALNDWEPAGRQYWVDTWTAQNPCGSPPVCRTRSYYDRELPTIATEAITEASVHLFPNPNDGHFELIVTEWPHRNASVAILDAAGRRVCRADGLVVDSRGWRWQPTGSGLLPPGLYCLCLLYENAVVATTTFIVR